MSNILFFLLLLGCPAELNVDSVSDSGDKYSNPEPPPVFGVDEKDDCDQKAVGSNVCNLKLYDQNGDIWELYEHKGKVVVLDFSTSWCYPCQLAGMHAQPLYDHYGGSVEFVTILVDGFTHSIPPTDDEISSWVDNHNITTAPILKGSREYVMDQSGVTGYLVGGFPTYVFIDKNMKIHSGAVGFNEEYIRTTINGLL